MQAQLSSNSSAEKVNVPVTARALALCGAALLASVAGLACQAREPSALERPRGAGSLSTPATGSTLGRTSQALRVARLAEADGTVLAAPLPSEPAGSAQQDLVDPPTESEAANASNDGGSAPDTAPAPLLPSEILQLMLRAPSSAVAQDADGNRCEAGGFSDHVQIGSSDVRAVGARDIYVRHIGSDGSAWGTTFGNDWDQVVTGVALGPDSSCVIVGLFQGELDLGGIHLQARSEYPFYSGFVAEVARRLRGFASTDVAIGATNAAALAIAPAVVTSPAGAGTPREPRVFEVFVRSAVPLYGAFSGFAPGSSLGIAVEADHQLRVAVDSSSLYIPRDSAGILQPPSGSSNSGGCAGYTGFDLCRPWDQQPIATKHAPNASCLRLDSTTASALETVCSQHSGCCAELSGSAASWSDDCVTWLNEQAGSCQCKTPQQLLGVRAGQRALPKQDACCNEVTQAVCANNRDCCISLWDHTCAETLSATPLACE